MKLFKQLAKDQDSTIYREDHEIIGAIPRFKAIFDFDTFDQAIETLRPIMQENPSAIISLNMEGDGYGSRVTMTINVPGAKPYGFEHLTGHYEVIDGVTTLIS
jgi:hypothetical protein